MTHAYIIAISVRAVVRFTNEPGLQHWKSMVKILAYGAGTRNLGLIYRWESNDGLSVYTDSSFPRKMEDRKSMWGDPVLHGSGTALMWWLSRAQKCVTNSRTKSEYVAIGECVRGIFSRRSAKVVQPMTDCWVNRQSRVHTRTIRERSSSRRVPQVRRRGHSKLMSTTILHSYTYLR